MADLGLARTAEPATHVQRKAWWELGPWWLRVLVIFLASRIVTTLLMLAFASAQLANAWTGAHPSYVDFANMWDGHWYLIVAYSGYSSHLPLTPDGQHVAENQWAFLPAYPMLVRVLMIITGIGFNPLAVFVSIAFAAGTALLFYRLMRTTLPASAALFSVVLFCFAPLSPILQVAYAESMFGFFIVLALLLLAERRYVLLVPTLIVVGFTRPGAIAFALVMLVHVIQRFRMRRGDPFPGRERFSALAVFVLSVVMGVAWIVIAGLVTGDLGAYTDTELAWRAAYIGYQNLLPFTPWVQGANWWVPFPWGIVYLLAAVAAFVGIQFTPAVRRLGLEVRAWIVAYVLYVLAVFFPQSSTFRVLFPTFPLLGALAQPRNPLFRVVLVLVFVALQWGWIYIAWWVNGYDWTPP